MIHVDDECCVSVCRSLACRHDCQRENPIDVIPSPAPPYLFLSAYGRANMARCSSMFASRHTTALAAVPHRPVGGRCSAGGASNIILRLLHKARYRLNAAIAFAESHSKKFHVWNFPFPFSRTFRHVSELSSIAQTLFHARFASVWHLRGLWVSSPWKP